MMPPPNSLVSVEYHAGLDRFILAPFGGVFGAFSTSPLTTAPILFGRRRFFLVSPFNPLPPLVNPRVLLPPSLAGPLQQSHACVLFHSHSLSIRPFPKSPNSGCWALSFFGFTAGLLKLFVFSCLFFFQGTPLSPPPPTFFVNLGFFFS